MQAANDPGVRPEFYRELLDTDLLVLIVPTQAQPGKFIAREGEKLMIKGITVQDKKLIPVFTSEIRLKEYIQAPDHLAQLKGQALLAIIAEQKNGMVLNPVSRYGKEFTPEEVAALVDGSMFRQFDKTELPAQQKTLISEPKDYPDKLVAALKTLFERNSNIEKAYIAQISMPDTGEPPHLLIAIDAAGDFEAVASGCGIVIKDSLGQGQFADLMPLRGSSLESYFNGSTPFYQK